MKNLIPLGKWLFLLPFVLFGYNHLMHYTELNDMVPNYLPIKTFWIILTGIAQLAFVISVLLGKFDKLGALLLSVMLITFILLVHVPGIAAGNTSALYGLVKDAGLAGGALMFAGSYARDNNMVG
jgi:putative oxidoreductase